MPTPACLATAVMGAPGSATNTARADSRMRWSWRAASAWRPLIGPCRPGLPPGRALVSVMKKSVAEDWNKPFRSDNLGTEDFVPVERVAREIRETGESTGGSDVVNGRDQEREPRER